MSTLPVIADDGTWVNGDYERLGRLIRDYDPNLALAWIPPDERSQHEKYPYAILDLNSVDPLTKEPSIVFRIEATETPEDVIYRLFTSDSKHGDVLERLNARNTANKAWKLKTQHDEMLEAQELALFMAQSNLNFMTIRNTAGELVKLDDQRRRIE